MKPQRQQIPRFGAVVECHFPPHPFSMPSGRHCRSPLYRNGSKFRNSVPLWSAIFRRTLSACLLDGIVVRPFTATAANSVIRCRCGVPFSAAPFQHAFWTALSFAPLPQRQQIPQFGAVVECHFPPHPFSMPSGRHCRSPLCRNGSKTRDPVPLRQACSCVLLPAVLSALEGDG